MNKLVLGVTGGVGAGKTTVLNILKQEFQACVIEADEVGRRLEEKGRPGYEAVLREFGSAVLRPDGEIDRAKLAGLVFTDPDALRKLNGMLHPMIYDEIQEEIRQECEKQEEIRRKCGKQKGPNPAETGVLLFVLEAAILFETGFDRGCDYTVYVRADEEIRIRRLCEERGYTRESAADRIANQLSDVEFRARANFVIENGGDMEETKRQVCDLVRRLILKAERR